MKRALLVLAVVVCVSMGVASPAQAQSVGQSAVTPWIELELDAIASNSVNPPRASRALAHVSRAMYLAALAGGNARDHAVAGAASTVLVHFFPARRPVSTRSPTPWPTPRAPRSRPVASSGEVSSLGRKTTAPTRSGRVPAGRPGLLGSDSSGIRVSAARAARRSLAHVEPRVGLAVSPGPPPAYGSAQFLAEMNEVYSVSLTLTEEQKRIADYWADGAGTVTPPGHWNVIALDLVRGAGWPTVRTARLFAALNTAQADAFISCWDTKYAYWSLRPVTAIRRLIDPTWSSYIVTPPFPSYTSGHSTTSGAASTVLAGFFPAQRRGSRRYGRGGRALASIRRHPLRERQRGRTRGRTAGRTSGTPRLPRRFRLGR